MQTQSLVQPVPGQQRLKQPSEHLAHQQGSAASALALGASRSRARSAMRLMNFIVLTFLSVGRLGRMARRWGGMGVTASRSGTRGRAPGPRDADAAGIGVRAGQNFPDLWSPLCRAGVVSVDDLAGWKSGVLRPTLTGSLALPDNPWCDIDLTSVASETDGV